MFLSCFSKFNWPLLRRKDLFGPQIRESRYRYPFHGKITRSQMLNIKSHMFNHWDLGSEMLGQWNPRTKISTNQLEPKSSHLLQVFTNERWPCTRKWWQVPVSFFKKIILFLFTSQPFFRRTSRSSKQIFHHKYVCRTERQIYGHGFDIFLYPSLQNMYKKYIQIYL